VSYDPDGAGSSPAEAVSPNGSLGGGTWYTSYGGGKFAGGGVLAFDDLTPGRVYRIIGIPETAVKVGLGTNIGP
jgi:hypothetical protein